MIRAAFLRRAIYFPIFFGQSALFTVIVCDVLLFSAHTKDHVEHKVFKVCTRSRALRFSNQVSNIDLKTI